MEYPSLDKPTAGAFRFNTDSSQLEIYDGNQWTGVLSTSPEQQTGGTRGLFMGGYQSPAKRDFIEYVNISTTGNSVDFGNLIAANMNASGLASRTRAIAGGGNTGSVVDTIQAVTISSTGDAVDYGNLTVARRYAAPMNSSTRGLFAGGGTPTVQDVIDYTTISTAQDAKDFGDLQLLYLQLLVVRHLLVDYMQEEILELIQFNT